MDLYSPSGGKNCWKTVATGWVCNQASQNQQTISTWISVAIMVVDTMYIMYLPSFNGISPYQTDSGIYKQRVFFFLSLFVCYVSLKIKSPAQNGNGTKIMLRRGLNTPIIIWEYDWMPIGVNISPFQPMASTEEFMDFPLEKIRVLVHLVLLQVASKHPELLHVIAAPLGRNDRILWGTGNLKKIKPWRIYINVGIYIYIYLYKYIYIYTLHGSYGYMIQRETSIFFLNCKCSNSNSERSAVIFRDLLMPVNIWEM